MSVDSVTVNHTKYGTNPNDHEITGLDSDGGYEPVSLYLGSKDTPKESDCVLECPTYVLSFSKFLTVLSETSDQNDNPCGNKSLYVSSSCLTMDDLETLVEYGRLCYSYNEGKPFLITKRCDILDRTEESRTTMENKMVGLVMDKYNEGGIERVQRLLSAANYMDVLGLFDFLCYFTAQKLKYLALQTLKDKRHHAQGITQL